MPTSNYEPMQVPDLLFNGKIITSLAWIDNETGFFDPVTMRQIPETRVFVLEGTIRSAKTVTAIIGFHRRAQRQKAKFALIAAKDYDAINDNILNAELGLLTMFPNKYKIQRDEIGGYYVAVLGSDKKILLAGYSDASKWKKILGKDIETIFIDEVNIADELFVKESFARQAATDHPITIMTLNGDDPNHVIYRERINKCIIIGDAPASIVAEMDTPVEHLGKKVVVKKSGYYYTHWTFKDNPKLTVKQRRAMASLFPIGSYYHKTRILGERGIWGMMIYADYMTPELLVDLNAVDDMGRPKYPIAKYTIGVDIAEARAANVFALLGFSADYRYVYIVDLFVFKSNEGGKSVGYTKKTELLKVFLAKHAGKAIEGIFVDSAEGNYIKDLQAMNLGIPVVESYKATILERIHLFVMLFSRRRCLINTPCLHAYQAFQSATWKKGREGKEREDNNLPMNDVMDATEYAATRHMNAILAALKRMVA